MILLDSEESFLIVITLFYVFVAEVDSIRMLHYVDSYQLHHKVKHVRLTGNTECMYESQEL